MPQRRSEQNNIVQDFRKGKVNIIVATSILEEGLDIQSCNLVIRFDLSATVCSFIQSRGRARVQNSDFLLIVRSGDTSTLERVENYIASGDIMRKESLSHASLPCLPLDSKMFNEVFYRVKSTGAVVTLSSSVALIYFYCSRLPSDGYFKPYPRFEIDKEAKVCTLNFPNSCPIPTVEAEGENIKMLKKLACLEACKKLHQIGALTDNLVPDIVEEETEAQELGNETYIDQQVNYVPPELVSYPCANGSVVSYHCYLIELNRNFEYNIPLQHVVLGVRVELEFNDENVAFELDVERGKLTVQLKYAGLVNLTYEQVLLCQRFQITLFRVLLDRNIKKMEGILDEFSLRNDLPMFDYLVLPCTSSYIDSSVIDWKCVTSVLFSGMLLNGSHNFVSCSCKSSRFQMHTISGLVCSCRLEDSLVCTPHNGNLYSIMGVLDDLHGNSLLKLRDGQTMTYTQYFKLRHGIDLRFKGQFLLKGRHIFPVQNNLQRSRQHNENEASNAFVELPPEICLIIMSPLSVATLYSFSFVPSIMHRIESLLIAVNLKRMHLDHCTQNVDIPTVKVLEAITTKKCLEKYHLESLETLGDSFLKYAASQQLFKTYQNHHEGLLSIKKEKIISNVALCKLGCDRKLPGFIRDEPFDPKTWTVPGDQSIVYRLDEELLSPTRKVYARGNRNLKSKRIADVVEALIGAFLSTGGEAAALSFMYWLGIRVDFNNVPYERHFRVQPEKHVNVKYLENLLKYSFRDASLLVEALTHGSYMLPEIPRCYQRLEFLGDAVLDYLVTVHLYHKYPGMSPGLLTDMRSASVNNDCYAQSAVRAGLHKHILHASQQLHNHIIEAVHSFQQSPEATTFGWESQTTCPKALGDIIESLAGAILIDSGYNKEIVFQSIRPLLEPMITPQTVKLHPVRELNDLCHKEHYVKQKTVVSSGSTSTVTIKIEANGITYEHSHTASDRKVANKLACKAALDSFKERMLGSTITQI
ncbi:Ribonuclease III [Bertholletia excelsa]